MLLKFLIAWIYATFTAYGHQSLGHTSKSSVSLNMNEVVSRVPLHLSTKLPVGSLVNPVTLCNTNNLEKKHHPLHLDNLPREELEQPPCFLLYFHHVTPLLYGSKSIIRKGKKPSSKSRSRKTQLKICSSEFLQPTQTPVLSGCCHGGMVQKRGKKECHCVFPIKLELLLFNFSFHSNWSSEFLQELASQLSVRVTQLQINNFYVVGLSNLNISINILPHVGTSFLEHDAATMRSLLMQKVHLHPSLLGNYQVLKFTWFCPSIHYPASSHVPAPSSHSSSSASLTRYKKESHANRAFVLSIGGGLLVSVAVFVLLICLCMGNKRKQGASVSCRTAEMTGESTISTNRCLSHFNSTRFIEYDELKEATNHFQPTNFLGEGGFGLVFKGVLNCGTPVAIKKLTSGGHQGDREFTMEVEMLSRLHHRNLVRLVGYCASHESSEKLLCYELVPNGNLEAWLHGSLGANCPLDWDTRMRIALDAAKGLAYLHEDCQPPVIHRDFKASNILLENNFCAKLSDFGLARQAPEGQGIPVSTCVMGTFGYVAPEYAMTGHLVVKSDVYSFGVVLLELLTGRIPVDMSQPSGQENLVTWARPILRNKNALDALADPRLGGMFPTGDFLSACTVAAACVAPEANQRPSMGEVVQSLKLVQRKVEHREPTTVAFNPFHQRTFMTHDSDGLPSIYSSALSMFDSECISETVLSEDLLEGR